MAPPPPAFLLSFPKVHLVYGRDSLFSVSARGTNRTSGIFLSSSSHKLTSLHLFQRDSGNRRQRGGMQRSRHIRGGGRMFIGQRQVHARSCTRMQYFDKFFLEHSNDNIGSVTCMPTESCTHLICFLFLIYIQLLCHCHYIFLCWLKPGLQWRRN